MTNNIYLCNLNKTTINVLKDIFINRNSLSIQETSLLFLKNNK